MAGPIPTNTVSPGCEASTYAGKEGTKFVDKNSALTKIKAAGDGRFSGTIAGDKQQLVFDLKTNSTLSLNANKISLKLPKGVKEVRCIVSYKIENGEMRASVKMDYKNENDNAITRDKSKFTFKDGEQQVVLRSA